MQRVRCQARDGDGGPRKTMEQAQCLWVMGEDSGVGGTTAPISIVAGLASWSTSAELAPARNLQAGHESLDCPAFPSEKGQSLL